MSIKKKGLLGNAAEFGFLMTRLTKDQIQHRHAPAHARSGLALVHNGRCGSTVLGTLLKQHPRMYWDGEALTPHRPAERWFRYLQGMRRRSRTQDLDKLMRFARDRWYVLSAKRQLFPSVEAMFQDLDAAGFDRHVFLYRANPLRWVVSIEVAVQAGYWHVRRGKAASLTRVQVPVQYPDGHTLVGRLQDYDGWHRQVRERLASRSPLELCYEDDVLTDPVAAYRRISRIP